MGVSRTDKLEPFLVHGKCKREGMRPSFFFPTEGDGTKTGRLRLDADPDELRTIDDIERDRAHYCKGTYDGRPCTYISGCLDYASTHSEYGVWGGTSREERVQAKVKIAREAKEQVA